MPTSINCASSVGDAINYERVGVHHRLVLMGAAQVGKTAIVQQFLYDQFPNHYYATVEEMHRGEYEVDGYNLTLDILDTSGAYAFPAMRRLAISRADAFVLVYAIDNTDSFEEVRKLKEAIFEIRPKGAPIVVVGNKSDLSDQRTVRKEIAETVATIDWENGYIECSAKTGYNIVAAFKEVLAQAHIRYALGSAVERRRRSLPILNSNSKYKNVLSQKRNSCVVS